MSEKKLLPRGNRVFERVGELLVHELQRKTFLEVSHHPGLDLAEQDKGFLLKKGGMR